jgi:hypothetical protein
MDHSAAPLHHQGGNFDVFLAELRSAKKANCFRA